MTERNITALEAEPSDRLGKDGGLLLSAIASLPKYNGHFKIIFFKLKYINNTTSKDAFHSRSVHRDYRLNIVFG